MSAPSTFRYDGGTHKSGKANTTIAQGKAVTYDSGGKLVLADSTSLRGVGISENDYITGDTVKYHKGGRSTVLTTGAGIAPAVYLKISGTAGVFAAEGTPTVATIASWGIALETPDADGFTLMEWL